jgi:hypothetical protein
MDGLWLVLWAARLSGTSHGLRAHRGLSFLGPLLLREVDHPT